MWKSLQVECSFWYLNESDSNNSNILKKTMKIISQFQLLSKLTHTRLRFLHKSQSFHTSKLTFATKTATISNPFECPERQWETRAIWKRKREKIPEKKIYLHNHYQLSKKKKKWKSEILRHFANVEVKENLILKQEKKL